MRLYRAKVAISHSRPKLGQVVSQPWFGRVAGDSSHRFVDRVVNDFVSQPWFGRVAGDRVVLSALKFARKTS